VERDVVSLGQPEARGQDGSVCEEQFPSLSNFPDAVRSVSAANAGIEPTSVFQSTFLFLLPWFMKISFMLVCSETHIECG
jgi:hypothetical protein